jgi:hypothetical protein
MSEVKNLVIKSIDSKSARKIVELYHYSGKSTQNSQIHFGVFLNERLEGVLQFGPSIDKRRMAENLGVRFNETLELNRMAFSDRLPKNSESRSIAICLRILKKAYPHLKIVVSFADACQCGDGTIYRASGFKLHSFKKNTSLLKMPDGSIVADKSLNDKIYANGKRGTAIAKENGAKPLTGFQMKYLFLFDKCLEKKFNFVDFDSIPNEVRMYKGQKRASSKDSVVSGFQSEEGGANPTDALQKNQIAQSNKKEIANGET